MVKWNYFTINIQGINVHCEQYYRHPNKPTILLVHGFLSSTFSYRRLKPILKDHFNILAIDLPPFGKTEKSKTFVYSYQNMGKLVVNLLQRLNLQKVYAVGHSMGGQILLYAAKDYPDYFHKIVLLCSSGYKDRSHPFLVLGSYVPYFSRIVKHWLARQGVWKSLCNVVHDHSLINEEMMRGYLEPFSNDEIFHALTKMIRDREGDLPSTELKQIEVPSLLVWGEEDRVVPIHIGKKLHQDLHGSQFISLQNTGHLVPEERPEHVSDYILRFCLI